MNIREIITQIDFETNAMISKIIKQHVRNFSRDQLKNHRIRAVEDLTKSFLNIHK